MEWAGMQCFNVDVSEGASFPLVFDMLFGSMYWIEGWERGTIMNGS